MTFTILKAHQSGVTLLAATLEQNAAYIAAFGYPSGRACAHCGKEVYASAAILEQLANAAPGSNLAHDYCQEIATLKAALLESEKQRPIQVNITEMPKWPNGLAGADHETGDPAAEEGSDAGS